MEEIEKNSSLYQDDIRQLPENWLCQTFEWLNSISDRKSFSLTCRRWVFIQNLSGRSLWFHLPSAQLSQLSLSQTSITINNSHISQLLNRSCKLELSSLSGCAMLPYNGLAQLKIRGLKLQTLKLEYCFGIAGDGFSLVPLTCPLLIVNSLLRCIASDMRSKVQTKFCLTLKGVDLWFYSLVSDDVVKAPTNECGLLRAVRITNCPNITGVGFQGFSQTLSYLEANYCKLEPKGILGFVCGGGFEYLSLSNISWISKAVGLAAIGARSTTRFRLLDFQYCRTAGDDSALAIAKGCPVLEEWDIGMCHAVNLFGWELIGLHCLNLKRTRVIRNRNLFDQGLQALRNECSRLAILYISWCARIRPEAILDV